MRCSTLSATAADERHLPPPRRNAGSAAPPTLNSKDGKFREIFPASSSGKFGEKLEVQNYDKNVRVFYVYYVRVLHLIVTALHNLFLNLNKVFLLISAFYSCFA